MSASRLYPKMYQGREDSSGYLARNERMTSASSPGYRGRVYIAEPGWHWLAGWMVEPRESRKPMLNLKFRPLTDQEAAVYCVPKGRPAAPRAEARSTAQSAPTNPDLFAPEQIPF